MRLPDWLGIGCVKCGTSWLWREMKKHPEIYAPKVKEVHFFNSASRRSVKSYMKRLGKAKPNQKTGEFTPDYFHHYEAMHVIKEYCPNVKLLVCFRNPVDRAFSNYKHARTAGRLSPETTFMDSFTFWRVRERSIYSRWLKRWWAVFPKKNLKIILYDDIVSRPTELLKEVWQFVGVDDKFISKDYTDWFEFAYHKEDEEFYKQQKPTQEQREVWLKYYKPHTDELEKMIQRDLSNWRK